MFEEDGMEYTDDDSYVMVGVEDFALALSSTDSDAESSAERKLKTEGSDLSDIGSSDVDNDEEHYLDMEDGMNENFQTTVACSDEYWRVHEFPTHIKFKDVMEIKDVVKDHVLAFLPAKSVVKFRTVSRDWDRWIASPFLAHKQAYLFRDICGFFCQHPTSTPTFVTLDHSWCGIPSPSLQFLPESVVIRSSCNGLLLCQERDGEKSYIVCNPVNQEWKVLPHPKYCRGSEPAIVLVFEPSEMNIAADFQVICAFYSLRAPPIVCFEIYSSKEGSWRLSAAECLELEDSTLKNGGFYMKGYVFWATTCDNILAFDMKNEFCGLMPLPPNIARKGVLSQMNGELCYIHAHKFTGNKCRMFIYGGINVSLKRSIVIDLGNEQATTEDVQALPCVNDDLMMILIGSSVYAYHVRDQKLKVISRHGNDPQACYLPYVNSLVRLIPDHSLSGIPKS
ncbi:F-box protein At5g07610-like isoform X2 [Cornus florida]|uniref:F-box protein At5g07610-like isoform X2 n=1 Tax=Cornus florida TaxID=4283 RepID=UPI0028A0A993|nr:F-box protein At5g07610-like isoform X2 [Cornus florida]